MSSPLSLIVESWDRHILSDPTIGSDRFAQLTSTQRKLGLLHANRPTCPFLRPHVLSRTQYAEISRAAEIIAGGFERLVARALRDDTLLSQLGLTTAEEKMARIDPGYSSLCVSSRLDTYLSESGFQFFEYNAESPAGIADQMQLEKLLFDLPHVKEFLVEHRHWRPQPHQRLLEALVAVYHEWGGDHEHPQIAIIDWEGVSTASEFAVLKEYFHTQGYPTVIADPNVLQYDGKELKADHFRIDLLYKRVIIHEFLQKFDDSHPLISAYQDHNLCMANSFRAKIAHKKAGFAVLSDPLYAGIFTPDELHAIQRHIPWTRLVREGTTIFDGHERNLLEVLKTERERLVLKPNDDYGGHGVVIGWETDQQQWEAAIALALRVPHVVQQRVPVMKVGLPMFTDHVEAVEMTVDFDPFLFQNRVEGGLVRLSSSSLSNISSGGGETALLVLEDA